MKRYIDHSESVKIPKFNSLQDANKAVEEMYWAIIFADAIFCDMLRNEEYNKLPYLGEILRTQRGRLANSLRKIGAA